MAPRNTKEKQALSSAWELDKLYGIRLSDAFKLNESFLLLSGKIGEEVIDTTFGEAKQAVLLVQRLSEEGEPTGKPFKVNSLASAIAEKIEAAVDGDFPAVVCRLEVPSTRNKGKTAEVLQYVSGNEADLLEEFGLDASTVGRAVDAHRPAGEQMGL